LQRRGGDSSDDDDEDPVVPAANGKKVRGLMMFKHRIA
jgi:hypothetical protein